MKNFVFRFVSALGFHYICKRSSNSKYYGTQGDFPQAQGRGMDDMFDSMSGGDGFIRMHGLRYGCRYSRLGDGREFGYSLRCRRQQHRGGIRGDTRHDGVHLRERPLQCQVVLCGHAQRPEGGIS